MPRRGSSLPRLEIALVAALALACNGDPLPPLVGVTAARWEPARAWLRVCAARPLHRCRVRRGTPRGTLVYPSSDVAPAATCAPDAPLPASVLAACPRDAASHDRCIARHGYFLDETATLAVRTEWLAPGTLAVTCAEGELVGGRSARPGEAR